MALGSDLEVVYISWVYSPDNFFITLILFHIIETSVVLCISFKEHINNS